MKTMFEKASDLSEKFKKVFRQRKKLKALENYSECAPVMKQQVYYLKLLRRCMEDGFLDEKEADFLDHMLTKYGLNFLDWSHKTKWLKSQMNKLATEQDSREPNKFYQYDMFEKKMPMAPAVPLELLAQKQRQESTRSFR